MLVAVIVILRLFVVVLLLAVTVLSLKVNPPALPLSVGIAVSVSVCVVPTPFQVQVRERLALVVIVDEPPLAAIVCVFAEIETVQADHAEYTFAPACCVIVTVLDNPTWLAVSVAERAETLSFDVNFIWFPLRLALPLILRVGVAVSL